MGEENVNNVGREEFIENFRGHYHFSDDSGVVHFLRWADDEHFPNMKRVLDDDNSRYVLTRYIANHERRYKKELRKSVIESGEENMYQRYLDSAMAHRETGEGMSSILSGAYHNPDYVIDIMSEIRDSNKPVIDLVECLLVSFNKMNDETRNERLNQVRNYLRGHEPNQEKKRYVMVKRRRNKK